MTTQQKDLLRKFLCLYPICQHLPSNQHCQRRCRVLGHWRISGQQRHGRNCSSSGVLFLITAPQSWSLSFKTRHRYRLSRRVPYTLHPTELIRCSPHTAHYTLHTPDCTLILVLAEQEDAILSILQGGQFEAIARMAESFCPGLVHNPSNLKPKLIFPISEFWTLTLNS